MVKHAWVSKPKTDVLLQVKRKLHLHSLMRIASTKLRPYPITWDALIQVLDQTFTLSSSRQEKMFKFIIQNTWTESHHSCFANKLLSSSKNTLKAVVSDHSVLV